MGVYASTIPVGTALTRHSHKRQSGSATNRSVCPPPCHKPLSMPASFPHPSACALCGIAHWTETRCLAIGWKFLFLAPCIDGASRAGPKSRILTAKISCEPNHSFFLFSVFRKSFGADSVFHKPGRPHIAEFNATIDLHTLPLMPHTFRGQTFGHFWIPSVHCANPLR